MSTDKLIVMLGGMLLLALLLRPFSERLRLPLAAVLVVTGFAGSEIVIWLGHDTGVRHDSFHDLIMYVFLPLLVFEAAFKMDAALLWRNLGVILLLTIPMLLLSTAVTAVLVYYGIGHPAGFPWIAALLTGALLSATDASPITGRFAALGVPKRLRVLLEGEDLFNDATAIVLFGILLYVALHPAEDISMADAAIRFGVVFFGGALIGLLTGVAFLFLSRLFDDHLQQALVTLVSAYTAFLLADRFLNVSGVMATLVTGLVMGRVIHHDFQDARGTFVDEFWSFNVYLAEALVFLLMGVTVSLDMFTERWLAIVIGIAALLIARWSGLWITLGLAHGLPGVTPVPPAYRPVLFMGSLRGAVVLALALALPTDLPYWWTVQSIAFGVVLFTLLVQAPAVEPTIHASGLADSPRKHETGNINLN